MIVISIKGEPAAERTKVARQVATLLQTAGKVIRSYKVAPDPLPQDCYAIIIEEQDERKS